MKLTYARINLDGRSAEYRDGSDDGNEEFSTPVLILGVEDFDDAQNLLDTLSRSSARKRAAKDSPPAPATGKVPPSVVDGGGRAEEVPKPVPAPVCETPECPDEGTMFDDDSGGRFCSLHFDVHVSIRREWHEAFTKAKADHE